MTIETKPDSASPVRQCHPEGLFDDERLVGQCWTCVRTRPRWEKKFAQWLATRKMPFFLPLITRRTVSHRKVRETEVPLFPGYVFVLGTHTKQMFTLSGCVVRLLLPRGAGETARLDDEIRSVHRLLAAGDHPALVPQWTPGERVRVLAGALAGATGQFVRGDGKGRLIVWIELLGVGAAVTLPPDIPLEPAEE